MEDGGAAQDSSVVAPPSGVPSSAGAPAPPIVASAAGAEQVIPPLGRAVGYLISKLGLVVARRFHQLLAELEIDPRHFTVMRAIHSSEGMSQNAVADVLGIPASSMVSLVDHLEGRGLVERRPHPSDRRARMLYLTPPGRSVLVRAVEVASGFEAALCQGMTPSEREWMIDRLELVAANLGPAVPVSHPDVAAGQGPPPWTEQFPG